MSTQHTPDRPGEPVGCRQDTLVCRCEEVTLAQLTAARDLCAGDPRMLKMQTRAGMGACQSRECRHLISRVAATHPAARNVMLSARPPVRLTSTSALAQAAGALPGGGAGTAGETPRSIVQPDVAGRTVTFTVDGRPCSGQDGQPIAAALMAAGVSQFRASECSGEPRGLFCAVGHCYECRVTVDGRSVRSCLTPLGEGMAVATQPAALPPPHAGVGPPAPGAGPANGSRPHEAGPMKADLAVIGAGPAGLAAAITARRMGLDVVVLDESPSAGGRLLCQRHEHPYGAREHRRWDGRSVAQALLDQAQRVGLHRIYSGAEVWGLFGAPGWQVMVGGDSPAAVHASAVLIATGAAEQPVPVPGWTLPGVVTAGAAHVMVNQWGIKPGRRAIVVGLDPLAIAAAQALAAAGIQVLGVVNPPPGPLAGDLAHPLAVTARLAGLSHLAPSLLLRTLGPLLTWRIAARLVAAIYRYPFILIQGIPLMFRTAALELCGSTRVSGVVLADQRPDGEVIAGTRRLEAADLVCLGGGLYPLCELAAAAECDFCYLPELGGHVPLHGPWGQTTRPGIFVAGSATGVESAPVAIEQGRVAGQAIALILAGRSETAVLAETGGGRERVRQVRASAPMQFLPAIRQGRAAMAALWAQRQAAAQEDRPR